MPSILRLKLNYSKLVFFLCWMTYSFIYLCRINFSAVLPALLSNGVITKQQAGLIATSFFFSYGIGQFLNGFLGDKLPPIAMLLTGLTTSATVNILFTFQLPFKVMAFIWGLNGLAQSMIWPAVYNLIIHELPKSMHQKAYLGIATSSPTGTFLAYLIAFFAVKKVWTISFYTGAIILLLLVFSWIVLRKVRTYFQFEVEEQQIDTLVNDSKTTEVTCNRPKMLYLIMQSGVGFLAISVLMQGMLKDGVNNWVPTILTEIYGLAPSFSIFLTMFLPIINLSGAFIATYFYNKFFKKNEILTAGVVFSFTVIPLVGLLFMNKLNSIVTIVFFAVFTTLMLGYNHLMITLAPTHFSKYKRSSSVSGMFNSMTYGGSAISSYGFASLSDKFGWIFTIGVWVVIALIGSSICFFKFRKWRSFKSDNRT